MQKTSLLVSRLTRQVEQYAEINGEYSLPREAPPPVPASVIQVPVSITADSVGGGGGEKAGQTAGEAEQAIVMEENPRSELGKPEDPSGPVPSLDSASGGSSSPKPQSKEASPKPASESTAASAEEKDGQLTQATGETKMEEGGEGEGGGKEGVEEPMEVEVGKEEEKTPAPEAMETGGEREGADTAPSTLTPGTIGMSTLTHSC